MGFFDGPVIETELPMQGAQVLSLIRELRSYTHTHTQCSKKILVRLFTMCSCLYGLKFLEVELYLSISVYIYIYIFFFFFFYLAMPCGMWDLSSPTREPTSPPALEMQRLNHWTAGKVPAFVVLIGITEAVHKGCKHLHYQPHCL